MENNHNFFRRSRSLELPKLNPFEKEDMPFIKEDKALKKRKRAPNLDIEHQKINEKKSSEELLTKKIKRASILDLESQKNKNRNFFVEYSEVDSLFQKLYEQYRDKPSAEIVHQLLDISIEIYKDGNFFEHAASTENFSLILSMYDNQHLKLDTKNKLGRSLLHYLVRKSKISEVEEQLISLLLAKHVDLANCRDVEGNLPIHNMQTPLDNKTFLCFKNVVDATKINFETGTEKKLLLSHCRVFSEQSWTSEGSKIRKEFLKYLIGKGADPQYVDENDDSCLHYICRYTFRFPQVELLQFFVEEQKLDPNRLNKYNENCLFDCVNLFFLKMPMIKYLLAKGAKYNIKSEFELTEGLTFLHLACGFFSWYNNAEYDQVQLKPTNQTLLSPENYTITIQKQGDNSGKVLFFIKNKISTIQLTATEFQMTERIYRHAENQQFVNAQEQLSKELNKKLSSQVNGLREEYIEKAKKKLDTQENLAIALGQQVQQLKNQTLEQFEKERKKLSKEIAFSDPFLIATVVAMILRRCDDILDHHLLQMQLISLLIKQNDDLQMTTDFEGQTINCLDIAIATGNIKLVLYLLIKGATPPNYTPSFLNKRTALRDCFPRSLDESDVMTSLDESIKTLVTYFSSCAQNKDKQTKFLEFFYQQLTPFVVAGRRIISEYRTFDCQEKETVYALLLSLHCLKKVSFIYNIPQPVKAMIVKFIMAANNEVVFQMADTLQILDACAKTFTILRELELSGGQEKRDGNTTPKLHN